MGNALPISLLLISTLPARQIPVLHVSPVSLAFVASRGDSAPAQQIRIRNIGSGALQWKAVPSVPWIRVSPASGTGPAIVTVAIDATRLSPGRHEGQVAIDAGDADDSPVAVAVTAEVAGSGGIDARPSNARADSAEAAADSAARVLQPAPPQSSTKPAQGAGPGEALRLDRSSMPPVTRNLPYSQAIPVSGGVPPYAIRVVQGRLPIGLALANGAVAGTARISGYYPVTVAVTDSASPPATLVRPLTLRVIILLMDTALVVQPPAIRLLVSGGQRKARARLAVGSGRQPLDWSASGDVAWLTVLPAGGTAPGVIQIDVAAESLAPGTYIGTVTVTMEGAPNSPARIPVQVTVQR